MRPLFQLILLEPFDHSPLPHVITILDYLLIILHVKVSTMSADQDDRSEEE